MTLAIKVVKIDSKIAISLPQSKSVKQTVVVVSRQQAFEMRDVEEDHLCKYFSLFQVVVALSRH
jgi:hypothetical protein